MMLTPAPHSALILVDVQPDFMPGGPLACYEGQRITGPIQALLESTPFDHYVATQDWHPQNHISFVTQHPGQKPFASIMLYQQPQTLWPEHCVVGTQGAQLHPDIDWHRMDLILRKGNHPEVDSYSAFQENHGPDGQRPSTGLGAWLRDRGVRHVYVAGLARDVCVLWTALDAKRLGFRVHFLWDLTAPVTPDTDAQTAATLTQHGIEIIRSESDSHL
ncbi:nicotinamidase [Brackiella oedipodis]|uniref:nicotinamidase n=1 Tax=Brackiella oedipodis TaxID=124225 RepID=UPI00048B0BDF|nr:nicotinamidase [Brackiella oedipodis]